MAIKSCCSTQHPFETFNVRNNWWPSTPKYLIIGESPGGPNAHYFYDEEHCVRIRRNLLMGLHRFQLISDPTLEEFKNGGFLFDHSIRCHLAPMEIKREWRRARKYESPRAAAAHHLVPSLSVFPIVWIMGYLARNAVADLDAQFPRAMCGLSAPYIPEKSTRYFVSRYLLNIGDREILSIVERFKHFLHTSEHTSIPLKTLE